MGIESWLQKYEKKRPRKVLPTPHRKRPPQPTKLLDWRDVFAVDDVKFLSQASQRLRILYQLTKGPQNPKSLSLSTGIYSGVLWIRLRDLLLTGHVFILRRGQTLTYNISALGNITLDKGYTKFRQKQKNTKSGTKRD